MKCEAVSIYHPLCLLFHLQVQVKLPNKELSPLLCPLCSFCFEKTERRSSVCSSPFLPFRYKYRSRHPQRMISPLFSPCVTFCFVKTKRQSSVYILHSFAPSCSRDKNIIQQQLRTGCPSPGLWCGEGCLVIVSRTDWICRHHKIAPLLSKRTRKLPIIFHQADSKVGRSSPDHRSLTPSTY